MKKTLSLWLAILLCVGCQQGVSSQVQEDEQTEARDTIDLSLISRSTDSITYRTTVTYSGDRTPGDFIMSAIYGVEEFDSFGEQLLEPEVDIFQLTMHLKHKGAYKPETIVLVTDGKPHKLEPNFIQAVSRGEFMLLFNYDIVKTRSVPRDIINAKSIQVKVRYNNGDAVYDATEEDRKAVGTVFNSFLHDGGKDYSTIDDVLKEHQSKQ